MLKLFVKSAVAPLTFILTASVALSCVNTEYDLSQGVDMDMTLLQNTAIPLGNVPNISISTLLDNTSSESSLFDVDPMGNMSISLGSDVITQSFKMPEVSIGGEDGIKSEDAVIKFNINDKYSGLTGDQLLMLLDKAGLPETIHFSGGNPDKLINLKMPIELDNELPEQILSVKSIGMDAALDFNFVVEEGVVLHICEGFQMEFPHYMVLAQSSESATYRVEDNYRIIFREDTKITHDSPLVLRLSFVKMDGLEDMIVEKENEDGKMARFFEHVDDVIVTGDIYLKASDYRGMIIPKSPEITMHVELDNLYMTEAEIKIHMDLQIANKKIEIGELPDIFSGDGTVVDLYNPIFRVKLNNDSPLQLDLNAGISAYSGDEVTDIHIGDYCKFGDKETSSVIIPANGEEEYYFSRQGKHDTEDGKDIELDNLGKIISSVPDSIIIHDILVEAEDTYLTIKANQEYKVDLEYEFFSPLAFGKDLNIAFNYDVDLGLDDSSMGIDQMELSMNLLNSIPLEFHIKGVALDDDGNELKNASVDMDLELAAGSLENPVPSPVKVTLNANDSKISISKLRMVMSAVSPDDDQLVGRSLNTSQGLGINDLSLCLPKGITLDLANTEQE